MPPLFPGVEPEVDGLLGVRVQNGQRAGRNIVADRATGTAGAARAVPASLPPLNRHQYAGDEVRHRPQDVDTIVGL